jgi:hypothetical protein
MLNQRQIKRISREIAMNIQGEEVELLRPLGDIEKEINVLISRNMDEERELNSECDKLMDQYAREIDRGSVDPHKMFLMIKKKLAKEKRFVL